MHSVAVCSQRLHLASSIPRRHRILLRLQLRQAACLSLDALSGVSLGTDSDRVVDQSFIMHMIADSAADAYSDVET